MHENKKITANDIVNAERENKKAFKKLCILLHKILSIFRALRDETINLDKYIINIVNNVNTEGSETYKTHEIPYCSSLSKYNLEIGNYLNKLDIHLQNKDKYNVPLIKKWSENYETHTYNLNIKKIDCQWLDTIKSCIVDNILINIPPDAPYVNDIVNSVINIGHTQIEIPFIKCNDFDNIENFGDSLMELHNFKNLLINILPNKLHTLNLILDKNIRMIEKSIDNLKLFSKYFADKK